MLVNSVLIGKKSMVINKTFTDPNDFTEWFICPVCNKQINLSVDNRQFASKNLHHIFGNANKRHSEEDGFMAYLHPECHAKLHSNWDVEKRLKQKCQEMYMQNHSLAEFVKRYGDNYLL